MEPPTELASLASDSPTADPENPSRCARIRSSGKCVWMIVLVVLVNLYLCIFAMLTEIVIILAVCAQNESEDQVKCANTSSEMTRRCPKAPGFLPVFLWIVCAFCGLTACYYFCG